MAELLVSEPKLGSSAKVTLSTTTSKVAHGDEEATTSLNFTAHLLDPSHLPSNSTLQVWSDLPRLAERNQEKKEREWKAFNFTRLDQTSLVASIPLRVEHVHKLSFGFTYRILHGSEPSSIQWLSHPNQDGQITFCEPTQQLPATNNLDKLVRLNSADGRVSVMNCQKSDMSGIDVSLATILAHPDCKEGDVEELDLCRLAVGSDNVSGLVVERTKATWCTSRTFQGLDSLSPDFGSSLVLLRFEDVEATSDEQGLSSLYSSIDNRKVMALLPLSTSRSTTTLVRSRHRAHDHGGFSIVARTQLDTRNADAFDQAKAYVLIACGPASSVHNIIKSCMDQARQVLESERLGNDSYESSLTRDRRIFRERLNEGDQSAMTPSSSYPSSPTFRAMDTDMTIETIPSSLGDLDDSVGCFDSTFNAGDDTVQAKAAGAGGGAFHIGRRTSPLDPRGGLGFCTWEALGPGVEPKLSAVVEAIASTEKRLGDGAITSVLIDDGWQDVVKSEDSPRGRLNSWELKSGLLDVDEARSESGDVSALSCYINHIRQRFPSVQHVGVWMTLAGYWDGIHPSGPISSKLNGEVMPLKIQTPFGSHHDQQRTCVIPSTVEASRTFWSLSFSQLQYSGVDFVKVDAQAEWDWLTQPSISPSENDMPIATLRRESWNSMLLSAQRWFGSDSVIHCMSGSSRFTNGVAAILPPTGTTSTAPSGGSDKLTFRNTDDFFPDVPQAHRFHLAHNAYNALLSAHSPSLKPDADMFSTCIRSLNGEDWSSYHGSFRAFSTAKLWISDRLPIDGDASHHAAAAALGLVAKRKDGSFSTVQADLANERANEVPGLPLASSLFEDVVSDSTGPALKMGLSVNSGYGAVIGLWNTRGENKPSVDAISTLDLSDAMLGTCGFFQGQKTKKRDYILSSRRSGSLSLIEQFDPVEHKDEHPLCSSVIMPVRLEAAEWDVVSAVPLENLADGARIGFLGLVDKYLPSVATRGELSVRNQVVELVEGDDDGREDGEEEKVGEAAGQVPKPTVSEEGEEDLEEIVDLPAAARATEDQLDSQTEATTNLSNLLQNRARFDVIRIAAILILNTLFHTMMRALGLVPNRKDQPRAPKPTPRVSAPKRFARSAIRGAHSTIFRVLTFGSSITPRSEEGKVLLKARLDTTTTATLLGRLKSSSPISATSVQGSRSDARSACSTPGRGVASVGLGLNAGRAENVDEALKAVRIILGNQTMPQRPSKAARAQTSYDERDSQHHGKVRSRPEVWDGRYSESSSLDNRAEERDSAAEEQQEGDGEEDAFQVRRPLVKTTKKISEVEARIVAAGKISFVILPASPETDLGGAGGTTVETEVLIDGQSVPAELIEFKESAVHSNAKGSMAAVGALRIEIDMEKFVFSEGFHPLEERVDERGWKVQVRIVSSSSLLSYL
ncbi:hypothetical protein IE53DRAFT_371916 [Violaceomyces palustris]|uniref:Uncharacterized protein n=1 Tax=Violaceomyces palustris TaxID=1673888 RepID=A0ACD0NMC4_9BASI|nr:hypothetical protein IE53DRAFT_371916 [Violaceomyces palustris]